MSRRERARTTRAQKRDQCALPDLNSSRTLWKALGFNGGPGSFTEQELVLSQQSIGNVNPFFGLYTICDGRSFPSAPVSNGLGTPLACLKDEGKERTSSIKM